jgi:hypothetical protein
MGKGKARAGARAWKKKPEKEQEQEEEPERGLTEQSMGQKTEKISLIPSMEFNFTILKVFKGSLKLKSVLGSTGLITLDFLCDWLIVTDKAEHHGPNNNKDTKP